MALTVGPIPTKCNVSNHRITFFLFFFFFLSSGMLCMYFSRVTSRLLIGTGRGQPIIIYCHPRGTPYMYTVRSTVIDRSVGQSIGQDAFCQRDFNSDSLWITHMLYWTEGVIIISQFIGDGLRQNMCSEGGGFWGVVWHCKVPSVFYSGDFVKLMINLHSWINGSMKYIHVRVHILLIYMEQ